MTFRLLISLTFTLAALAGEGLIKSVYSAKEFALTADPAAQQWKDVVPVVAENGPLGEAVPGHRTEIRSRWTEKNLYVLFVCPYEQLFLKPDPVTATETNKLWEWDVAEIFVGWDFDHIGQYKEFEVSPRGEWVDLDIDRKQPKMEVRWKWDSGFRVKTRIDEAKKVWYAEMRIPYASIDTRPAKDGQELRVNFYRIQGPKPDRKMIAWQPTGARNYHLPEAFGKMRLVKKQ